MERGSRHARPGPIEAEENEAISQTPVTTIRPATTPPIRIFEEGWLQSDGWNTKIAPNPRTLNVDLMKPRPDMQHLKALLDGSRSGK